jgi:hypothetical protein
MIIRRNEQEAEKIIANERRRDEESEREEQAQRQKEEQKVAEDQEAEDKEKQKVADKEEWKMRKSKSTRKSRGNEVEGRTWEATITRSRILAPKADGTVD